MLFVEATNADSAWRQLADRLRTDGKVQAGRDQQTRELLHAGFRISNPRQRLVFARPMNPAFAIAEVISILAGFDDVEWLAWWNPRLKQLAADEGSPAFNGAYGERLGSQPKIREELASRLRHRSERVGDRLDQLRTATDALKEDPNSREVVLQFWDAERDLPNPTRRSNDIPCNVVSHLLLRDGRLEWFQFMRSNDIVWGLPYNLVQFTALQEIMAGWLGAEVGSYRQISSSLHVYQRHWELLDNLDLSDSPVPVNTSDLRIESYDLWQNVISRMVDCVNELVNIETPEDLEAVPKRYTDLPHAYQQWVALLTAEAIRKKLRTRVREEIIEASGEFWAHSWRQWAMARSR